MKALILSVLLIFISSCASVSEKHESRTTAAADSYYACYDLQDQLSAFTMSFTPGSVQGLDPKKEETKPKSKNSVEGYATVTLANAQKFYHARLEKNQLVIDMDQLGYKDFIHSANMQKLESYKDTLTPSAVLFTFSKAADQPGQFSIKFPTQADNLSFGCALH